MVKGLRTRMEIHAIAASAPFEKNSEYLAIHWLLNITTATSIKIKKKKVPQLRIKPCLSLLKSHKMDAMVAAIMATSSFSSECPIKIKNNIQGRKLFKISFNIHYLSILSAFLHHVSSALEDSIPASIVSSQYFRCGDFLCSIAMSS